MPCFAMISSCSMCFACSEHCYLILFQPCSVFSLSLGYWYLLHFCHACLNLLCCDVAVAQCSSFVTHLLYITPICFIALLGCCSIVSWCILRAIMLLIAESCHPCFACHLQNVHPFPVISISFSTEIISSFQWHTWIAKIMPCSSVVFPKRTYALHITSRMSCHVLHHDTCALHRGWLWSLSLCPCCG